MTITDLDADSLSRAIHAKEVSCREVMRATLDRIAAVNPQVNAIVNVQDEADLLRQADAQREGRDIDSVLRRLEWKRGPDRWAMIAATDFLARSFTWQLPGAGTARGLGMAALQLIGPAKSALARQMMFGSR